MNRFTFFYLLLIYILTSCKDQSVSEQDVFSFPQYQLKLVEYNLKDDLDKKELLTLLTYPVSKQSKFENQSISTFIDEALDKANQKTFRTNIELGDTLIFELDSLLNTSQGLAVKFDTFNNTKRKISIDTVFIRAHLSAFELIGELGYTVFEAPEIEKGERKTNNFYLPKDFLEDTIWVKSGEGIPIKPHDIIFELSSVKYSD